MPLFRIADKNVLFIHVPKTGGTSVERALSTLAPMSLHGQGDKGLRIRADKGQSRPVPMQHLHGRLLEAIFAPQFIDYAFMIVRDPVERMISEYKHSRALDRVETRWGFSSWLRLSLRVARAMPEFRNNHFRPQSEFACFGARVFHFEDGLGRAMTHVGDELGVLIPALPHERRSASEVVKVTASDRAFIERAYADDFANFGYIPARVRA